MDTETNWLPLCSRTDFNDRLLLSMSSLQSLGSYCGTPSCTISAQYTKSFTVEKKRRYSWCLLRKKLIRVLSERGFFCFNLDANISTEFVDKLRSWTRLFNSFLGKWMRSIIFKNQFFFVFMCFNTGGIFVTNVRKFSEDRHWNFITMSYRTTCWLKIRILEAIPVLSVDPSHINKADVAVSDMVCRLPPNHGNYKFQTPLVIGPPTQSLGAYHAHHVWRPSFILVSKFNTKISLVSTLYESCDWLPIRSNGVFSIYVAEHVRLISARSSCRSHVIHQQNKSRYKLVINWCHRSPPRSVFSTTTTTTQIFRNTYEAKKPVLSQVEFPIHFPGAAVSLTLVLIHQLYALPHQFLENFDVLWLQTDLFTT